jgi:periplasmic protein CpxP/Spy
MSTSLVRRALRAATQAAVATSLVVAVAATAGAQQPVSKDPPAQPPAGGGGGGRGMGGRGMAAIMDSLNLTAAQRTKVDSINTAFQAKMPAFTPGQQLTEEERAARQKVGAERTAAIKAVLTPEQVTKYDALMEAMRSRMGGGRPQTR